MPRDPSALTGYLDCMHHPTPYFAVRLIDEMLHHLLGGRYDSDSSIFPPLSPLDSMLVVGCREEGAHVNVQNVAPPRPAHDDKLQH